MKSYHFCDHVCVLYHYVNNNSGTSPTTLSVHELSGMFCCLYVNKSDASRDYSRMPVTTDCLDQTIQGSVRCFNRINDSQNLMTCCYLRSQFCQIICVIKVTKCLFGLNQ